MGCCTLAAQKNHLYDSVAAKDTNNGRHYTLHEAFERNVARLATVAHRGGLCDHTRVGHRDW